MEIGYEANMVRWEGMVDGDGTHYGLVSPVDYVVQCVPTNVSGSVDTLNQAIAVQEIDDLGGGGVRGAIKMNVVVTSDDVGTMERVTVGQQIREFVDEGGVSQTVLRVWGRTIQTQKMEGMVGEGEGQLCQFEGSVGEREGGLGGKKRGEWVGDNKSNATSTGLTGEGEGVMARGSDVTALRLVPLRTKPGFDHRKDINVVVINEVL